MEITRNTRVAGIREEYGGIGDAREVFGRRRGARYSIRALATKAITVQRAARVPLVPLDESFAQSQKRTSPQAVRQ